MNKPILSDEQLLKADLVLVKSDWKCPTPEVRLRQAAQAQRDADLKWLCEEVEKALLTDDEMSEALCPYEEIPNKRHGTIARTQLQKVLALLREETMRMDRFNDSDPDDIPLDYPEYIEGMEARQIGQPISANPYSNPIGSSFIDLKKRNRWAAGWADQDMMLRGDTES